MNRIGKLAVFAFLAMAVAPVLGKGEKKEKQEDVVKATVKEITAALGKGDVSALKAALGRAETIQANQNEKKFAAVVKAIGRGVTHKDPAIARASVDSLASLKVPGSAKSLGKLLSPGAKVPPDRVALHVAAIAAAGEIHDKDSLKALEKAMQNPNREIAEAAGKAFAGYRNLDEKPKAALVKKLVKALGGLEKSAASARDEKAKEAAGAAATALNASLAALTGETGITTSKDWSAWLKKGGKGES